MFKNKSIDKRKISTWLERLAFFFLILMVLFSPHSIAASQIAWLIGLFLLLSQLFFVPKFKLQKTPLDLALWSFFFWSLISSLFSYTPLISLDKLRSVAIFLVFYFIVNLVRDRKVAIALCFTLIASCMINVIYVPLERLIGRGVEIHGLSSESPLTRALLMEGDTLLKANNKKIHSPEELVAEIEKNEETDIFFYRPDFYYTVKVRRSDLLNADSAIGKLGIQAWSKSHNWRSTGFYGHWTTYADVLQLIASLAFGILTGLASRLKFFRNQQSLSLSSKETVTLIAILLCFLMMIFALILSGTRGPQVGLLLSVLAIIFLNKNRRIISVVVAVLIPIVITGLVYLHQSRRIGFIDEKDDSTRYRQIVYREAIDLWLSSPRHIIFGVGMDSIRVYAVEWKLFDNGKLPIGHFHSTPIQLLVERGLPALLIWVWIIWIYASLLLDAIKNACLETKGVFLGIFGGLLGFLTSGMVHYNLGDQEVAMVFFLLMGLAVVIYQSRNNIATPST